MADLSGPYRKHTPPLDHTPQHLPMILPGYLSGCRGSPSSRKGAPRVYGQRTAMRVKVGSSFLVRARQAEIADASLLPATTIPLRKEREDIAQRVQRERRAGSSAKQGKSRDDWRRGSQRPSVTPNPEAEGSRPTGVLRSLLILLCLELRIQLRRRRNRPLKVRSRQPCGPFLSPSLFT